MTGIVREAGVFAAALLTGAIVRLSYETLCCLRALIRHGPRLLAAEDFLFWIVASGYVFVQIYQTSSGVLRWHIALGIVLGAFFAHVLPGKIAGCVKKILRK